MLSASDTRTVARTLELEASTDLTMSSSGDHGIEPRGAAVRAGQRRVTVSFDPSAR